MSNDNNNTTNNNNSNNDYDDNNDKDSILYSIYRWIQDGSFPSRHCLPPELSAVPRPHLFDKVLVTEPEEGE